MSGRRKTAAPVCRGCPYMRVYAYAKSNENNGGTPRGLCECAHKDAVTTFNRVCPRSPRKAGFIGFTERGGSVPAIKNSPRWCPLRFEEREKGAADYG